MTKNKFPNNAYSYFSTHKSMYYTVNLTRTKHTPNT